MKQFFMTAKKDISVTELMKRNLPDTIVPEALFKSGAVWMNQKRITDSALIIHTNETILVVDSFGLYDFRTVKPTIVILQESPKINLERLLKIVQPKLVIADGSNYKSYVSKWKKTCIKNKTPFHSTMQKGAYILK